MFTSFFNVNHPGAYAPRWLSVAWQVQYVRHRRRLVSANFSSLRRLLSIYFDEDQRLEKNPTAELKR